MNTDNVFDLVPLILQHKWLAVSIFVILIVARIFKGDLAVPLLAPYLAKIPARVRVWIVLGLGLVSAPLQKVADGVPWRDALIGGVIAAALAVLTHQTLIESLRDGREFFAGSSSSTKTIPPAGGVVLLIALAGFAVGSSSCALFQKAPAAVNTACNVIDTAKQACTVIRYYLPDGSVGEQRVSNEELASFGQAVGAKRAAPSSSATPAASSSALPGHL